MSQHDMNIANQGFPAFRADLNDALAALVSTSSGATAPATTFAHQLWVDTAANPSVLKIRNADNDAFITIGAIDQTGDTFILRPAAGSASVPAYSTSADINTGIFFPTADTIGLTVGGVEAARLVSGLLSVPANSTAASAVRLFEDTDNGTNRIDIIAPAAITSDRTLTLPDNTGTIITTASTFAGTGPAFNAFSGSGTAMTNGVYVKVTFDTERFDTNSNFASSRFTPTVAGYYQINSHLVYLATVSVGQVVLALYKNGAVETYTNFVTDTANSSSINLSYLISLDGSTDYVEMFLFMSGAGTLSAQGGAQTAFNGFLARAA